MGQAEESKAVSGSAISAEVPDWSRESCGKFSWKPAAQLLRSVRAYEALSEKKGVLALLRRRWTVSWHRFWSVVCAADIPVNSKLGGGLLLPHPTGVVIHPEVGVGPNCLLFQQVTLGRGGPIPGAPTLGGHVDVGAGAKILGGVHIGDHVVIGANAVVLCDIPSGATAVGIPARVITHAGPSKGESPPELVDEAQLPS